MRTVRVSGAGMASLAAGGTPAGTCDECQTEADLAPKVRRVTEQAVAILRTADADTLSALARQVEDLARQVPRNEDVRRLRGRINAEFKRRAAAGKAGHDG